MVIFQMKISACSGKLWNSSFGWICAEKCKCVHIVKKRSYVWADSSRLIGPSFQRKGRIDSCWFFRSFVKSVRHFFLILCMMLEAYKLSKVMDPEFWKNIISINSGKMPKWPKNGVFRIEYFFLWKMNVPMVLYHAAKTTWGKKGENVRAVGDLASKRDVWHKIFDLVHRILM